jgi:predicted Zn-dependent protease
LTWVLSRFPDDLDARLVLAECRIEQGQYAEAITLLQQLLKDDPTSHAAIYLRGKAEMDLGDAVAAEPLLRRAMASRPGDPEAMYQLLLSLRAQKKDDEAATLSVELDSLKIDIANLEKFYLQLNPGQTEAAPFREAGIIALRVGRAEEGENLLHQALMRNGKDRAAHAALAEYYEKVGSRDRAELHKRLAKQP